MTDYKYHYTYLIANLNVTSKERYYIGVHSSNNLDNNYMSSSTYLKDIIKLSINGNFEKTIIEIWPTRAGAIMHEIWLHGWYNVKDNRLFYNKSNAIDNGFDTTGSSFNHTKETKRKMSLAKKGKPGIPRSPETRKKISQTNKLKMNDPVVKEKISNAMKGCVLWNKGKTNVMPVSARKKISEFQKNRKR